MRTSDYPRICANCKWWEPSVDNGVRCSQVGACHRYPPVVEECGQMGRFPSTFEDCRCGEYAIMRQPRVTEAVEQ